MLLIKRGIWLYGGMLNINIGKEKTEYYQMDDESLGEPCFISTDELYKLVIEWKEMKIECTVGRCFPLTLELILYKQIRN